MYEEKYKLEYTFKDADDKDQTFQLCNDYYLNKIAASTLNYAVKYAIIFLNTVIRYAVIYIINKVGQDTDSARMSFITDCVFICQFFNTGFVLMLCSANFDNQGFFFGGWFRDGVFSDFNQSWFDTFGDTIVGAMRFNCWYPVASEIMWFSIRLAKRLWDQVFLEKDPGGDETKDQKTKCVTIQQYVNTYCGPLYYMHYKYSAIMNIIFITFMFGPGIPILFPYAAIAIAIRYVLENYMLYYVYKEPPAYDEKLNNSVLSNLTWAPALFLGFGYWMLSNHQLLASDLKLQPLEQASTRFLADHYWYEAFTGKGLFASGPAGFMLLFWFILMGYQCFGGYVSMLTNYCCKRL